SSEYCRECGRMSFPLMTIPPPCQFKGSPSLRSCTDPDKVRQYCQRVRYAEIMNRPVNEGVILKVFPMKSLFVAEPNIVTVCVSFGPVATPLSSAGVSSIVMSMPPGSVGEVLMLATP